MKSKTRLGRGIDALFAESLHEEGAQVIEIPIEDIYPNPAQPRKQFDPGSIAELGESIKSHGLISPILVRKMNSRYEIIAGERRFQACKIAGIDKVPSLVKDISDADAFKISLVENLQREDLNPMEEAEAYYTLKEQFSLTHQDIAEAVHKERSTITNALRLMNLPGEVKQALRDGHITTGHARAILMMDDAQGQLSLLNRIITRSLSVRETEKIASAKGKKRSQRKRDPYWLELSSLLTEKLGTNVTCSWGKNKGKIVINVSSREEMQRVIKDLCQQEAPF
ncbi:MAG TPA: ParB/RepB/Spo0J family partition protein [Deltaproteobacteria bacterium]|nr:ParB/RepB/Spo0J family partition protein [Deltaproteobacteria bacterium]